MNPGSVISALRMLPPNHELRSKTATLHPALARIEAPIRLEIPLPKKIAL
jgi:hypothetical protein